MDESVQKHLSEALATAVLAELAAPAVPQLWVFVRTNPLNDWERYICRDCYRQPLPSPRDCRLHHPINHKGEPMLLEEAKRRGYPVEGRYGRWEERADYSVSPPSLDFAKLRDVSVTIRRVWIDEGRGYR
jgi:hypothetical protein